MSVLQAHLICIALVGTDFVARTWRMQWLLVGLKHPLPFGQVFVHTVLGEAASSLTPLRLGGEPARAWAMTREGVPVTVGVVGIGVELLVMTPVMIAGAALVFLVLAPDWWSSVGPTISGGVRRRWPWVMLVAALLVVAWLLMHRVAPAAGAALRRELAAARMYVRGLPRWPLIACALLTVVSAAARVAILPVLALTLPYHSPAGTVVVGSFVLLFSQLLLPTPAGVGAVELGFLGGAAGEMGADEARLLLVWRFYTTILGIILGLALAGHRYGWSVLARRGGASTTGGG